MKYDFTSVIDRMGFDALAVENLGDDDTGFAPIKPSKGFDFIPMWVADMNFATAPSVTEALRRRIEHPLYGYYRPKQEYFDSIIRWQTELHGHKGLVPDHIGYENGVHGLVTSAVNVLTRPGEKIFVHRPTYIGFIFDIDYQGRFPVYSDLKKDEHGVYRMDFEDMEKQLRDNDVHLAIFCSPHNPTGRVWERWELEKAMALFEKYEVYVISDEIWADIEYEGRKHIPTQLVNDWAKNHAVSAYALSKTFNLAGFSASYHIIYNKYLRDRICHFGESTHYNTQNVLAQHALIGAYSDEGREWLKELLTVLDENAAYLTDEMNSIDGVSVTRPEGTYMVFADLTDYCARTGRTQRELLHRGWEYGVGWQDGKTFGGPCHLRLNIALPFSRLKEACRRMKEFIFVE